MKGGVKATKGGVGQRTEGLEGSKDGVEGSKDGVEGRKDGVEERKDGVEGSKDGVEERKDGVEERKDGGEAVNAGWRREQDMRRRRAAKNFAVGFRSARMGPISKTGKARLTPVLHTYSCSASAVPRRRRLPEP